MILHTNYTSPYGRLARMVLIEKGLEDRIPVEVPVTRTPDTPYYDINPSGRVPYLVLDDGTGLEESALICGYLDHLDNAPTLAPPEGRAGLEVRRLEAMARSMLDGLGVWGREYLYRPPEIHSDFIIGHEKARAHRMCDALEREMDHPAMTGPLNMAQLTLACVLHGRENSPPGFDWRKGHPKLAAFIDRIGERDPVSQTVPPKRDH